jgi:hypothetical protein
VSWSARIAPWEKRWKWEVGVFFEGVGPTLPTGTAAHRTGSPRLQAPGGGALDHARGERPDAGRLEDQWGPPGAPRHTCGRGSVAWRADAGDLGPRRPTAPEAAGATRPERHRTRQRASGASTERGARHVHFVSTPARRSLGGDGLRG